MKAQEIFSKVLLMPELNGMSVVVTRAAHQAEELCQLIETAGGRPVQVPVTRIEPAAEASAKLALLRPNLQSINVAIFISPNAATYGLNLLGRADMHLPSRCTVIAVGPGTARVLINGGLKVNAVPQERFDSEGLLELPELQKMASKRVLLFRGLAGRDQIARVLEERGASIVHLPCYERLPTSDIDAAILDAWANDGYDALILTSTSAVDHLQQLLGDKMEALTGSMRCVVSSERIAKHCRANGFDGPLLVAQNASMPALVQALSHQQKLEN